MDAERGIKRQKIEKEDKPAKQKSPVADDKTNPCSQADNCVPSVHQDGSDEHSRCKYYIEKKKRCCRTQPPKGQEYCVEHAHNLGVLITFAY